MNAIEFVKEKLTQLIMKFPFVRVRYDYHEFSDTHSVEVVPNKFYHEDDNFNEWQKNTLIEFMSLYGNESLCFLTDDSILGLDKVDFELSGSFYAITPTVVSQADNFFFNLSNDKIGELFKDFEPKHITSIYTNQLENIKKSDAVFIESVNVIVNYQYEHDYIVDTLRSKDKEPIYSDAGLDNYSLAA